MINIKKVKRLRNGALYENYSTDNGGLFPIHGRYQGEDKIWYVIQHTEDGMRNRDRSTSNYDLIEEPLFKIDQKVWDVLDDKYRWIAKNKQGHWVAFPLEPTPQCGCWRQENGYYGISLACLKLPKIPPDLWRETLTKRPGIE